MGVRLPGRSPDARVSLPSQRPAAARPDVSGGRAGGMWGWEGASQGRREADQGDMRCGTRSCLPGEGPPDLTVTAVLL